MPPPSQKRHRRELGHFICSIDITARQIPYTAVFDTPMTIYKLLYIGLLKLYIKCCYKLWCFTNMCNVKSAADPALPAKETEWRRSAYVYTERGIVHRVPLRHRHFLPAQRLKRLHEMQVRCQSMKKRVIHTLLSQQQSSLYSKSKSK